MSELDLTRAKILGALIQDARAQAGRSVDDCAQVLGITPEEFAQAEDGEFTPSLPHLEILAMYLQVPMSHFWNSSADSGPKPASDFGDFMVLRQRIIGALLSQARLQAKVTVEDMAQELGVEGDLIGAYEAGERPIPLFELEQMGKVLEVPLDYFSETGHGPLARHEVEQKIQRRFDELPPEVKAFVTEPINLSYLETAMRLSELDVHRLRSIAEGILDITF